MAGNYIFHKLGTELVYKVGHKIHAHQVLSGRSHVVLHWFCYRDRKKMIGPHASQTIRKVWNERDSQDLQPE